MGTKIRNVQFFASDRDAIKSVSGIAPSLDWSRGGAITKNDSGIAPVGVVKGVYFFKHVSVRVHVVRSA